MKKSEMKVLKDVKSNGDDELLTEVIEIDDTPFSAVKVDDKWFLALGKYRLTDLMESKEECIEATKDTSWYMILAVMSAVCKEMMNDEGVSKSVTKKEK